MKEIPIYKAEATVEGLAEKIQANSRITYAQQLEPIKDVDRDKVMASLSSDFMNAHADVKDDDLYFTKSILVSSNWNLNDDVFDKYETWAARHTPAHKPTNLGHDEHHIVGHMTDNWVIGEDGKVIADSTPVDDVPELFHIVNAAVIYTTWADKALIERTQKLIAEIEAGTKFVSMECLFSNFAYAIISPEGQYYTLARSQETAFLTKHLRAYGGKGVYEGYKVGRLPRNIMFSAKGYVDNPGNPTSVILAEHNRFHFGQATQKNPFLTNSGVSIPLEDTQTLNTEQSTMSEDIYKAQAEEAKGKVAKLESAIETLREQHTKAGLDKLNSEIETLTKQVTELTTERDELVTAKTVAEEGKTRADAKVVELTKSSEELQTKVDTAEADALAARRVAQLVEAGATAEDAAAKVEKFTELNDEQWGVIAESIIAAFPQKDDDKKDDKKKKDKGQADESDEETDSAEANADDESLENAEADKDAAALAAKAEKSGSDDELAQTRKELRKAIASRLGRNDDEDESNEK